MSSANHPPKISADHGKQTALSAACRLIAEGESVNRAARDCGFQNLSFFTEIFKQQTGMLPSACKKHTNPIRKAMPDRYKEAASSLKA